MKNLIKISFLSFAVMLAVFMAGGCTNFLSPNSGTSSPNISVKIVSPATNDSVAFKGKNVQYQYQAQTGLYAIELHTIISGTDNAAWYPANSNGSDPVVPINLDSTLVGSRISFYLIYYDKTNNSVKSDTAKNILVTEVMSPPYAPYNVTLTQITSTSINIAWKDSSLIASGFEVYRRLGFTGGWVLAAAAPPGAFNVTDSGLLAYQVYAYKVVAINKFGTATSAVVDNSGAYYAGNIYPPTNLTAKAVSKNLVQLDWKDNSSNETYFRIERRYTFSNFETVGNTNPNVTTFNDSSVVAGTEYFYRIKAFSASDSSWSNVVNITTPISKK